VLIEDASRFAELITGLLGIPSPTAASGVDRRRRD
jgi:hypothetical protein